MKEAAYPNLGVSLTHETWQEQAAHAYCLIVQALYDANIKMIQSESNDTENITLRGILKAVLGISDDSSGELIGSRVDGLSNLALNIYTAEEDREDTWSAST